MNILTVIGVVFIVLKLVGVIAWSWWWVTAPFWGAFAIWASIAVVIAAGAVIALVLGRQGK